MTARRTVARGLVLLCAAGLAGAAEAGSASPAAGVPRLVFPVVGRATYGDDFGEARWQGRHEGIDIVAPRKAIAVAAEAGTVKMWTTSAAAGCMLYLYGQSGTTYLYIHLNNDLGRGNDNRGRCVPGVAYAPGLRNGARVQAGEPLGLVGNSGDADAAQPHLHFEVHPGGGAAVDPFPHLRRAQRLLFPVSPRTTVTLTIAGTVLETASGTLTVRVSALRAFPAGLATAQARRLLTLALPAGAQIDDGAGTVAAAAERAADLAGKQVLVLTEPAPATLDAALGRPGALRAARVALASGAFP